MGKLFKGIVALVLVLALSGCSSSTSSNSTEVGSDVVASAVESEVIDSEVGITTTVFELVESPGYYSRAEIVHDGDTIISHSTVETRPYHDMTKEQAIDWFYDSTEYYESEEGYEYSIEFGENSVTEKLSVDLTVADLTDEDSQMPSISEENIRSFEFNRNMLLGAGYTELQ